MNDDRTGFALAGQDERVQSRLLLKIDAIMNRLGLHGPFSRDVVFAGGIAALSIAVLVPLLGPISAALGIPVTPSTRAAAVILVGVQALTLVLRRIAPRACLMLVATFQLALAAVVPDDTTIRMAAPPWSRRTPSARVYQRTASCGGSALPRCSKS